ncbi:hypothetical protein FN846DRAFT_495120 [Sphaerosporella brunnea]|uniref:Uncharacterized protein n=1 Tax=Sphaerosporella brunnea TaxID=1250544 RepID=A0A5J5F4H6_9PEZI|nr:hypothetical protein FN846DRAFT_495120 [Sphaerosporella brunnea]
MYAVIGAGCVCTAEAAIRRARKQTLEYLSQEVGGPRGRTASPGCIRLWLRLRDGTTSIDKPTPSTGPDSTRSATYFMSWSWYISLRSVYLGETGADICDVFVHGPKPWKDVESLSRYLCLPCGRYSYHQLTLPSLPPFHGGKKKKSAFCCRG